MTLKRQQAVADKDVIASYPNIVGGKDLEGDGWIYVPSPRALLDDAFSTLSLKRNLESGALAPHDAPTGVMLGRVAHADAQTVEEALICAERAVPLWAARPLDERVDSFIGRLHDEFAAHADEIVDIMTAEGHSMALARWEVSGMLGSTSSRAREFYRSQLELSNFLDDYGRQVIVRRCADGVVCVNPPANAATASAVLAIASMVAGNSIVIRAPRSGPLGVMYVMRNLVAPILDEIDAPAGILNVVCGSPGEMLDAWIESPRVNDIMYFGSSDAGLEIEQRCVRAGKKPILELAGNDAVVIWRDAHIDYAADALTESFQGSGQLCMIPNQAIVHPAIADELIEKLLEHSQRFMPGYPEDEPTLLSPVLRREKFFAFIEDAVSKGATLIKGGRSMQLDGSHDDFGMFLEPTIIRIDGLEHAREILAVNSETFFPLLPVVVAEHVDDELLMDRFVDYLNSNPYGLRNSVWASEKTVIDRFVRDVRNGGLLKINDSHFGFVAGLPTHGGTGLTGGAFGEANVPVIRTTHLQGVSIAGALTRPRDAAIEEWRHATGRDLASEVEAH